MQTNVYLDDATPDPVQLERSEPTLTLWLVRLLGFDGMLPALVLVGPGLILLFFGRGAVFNAAAVCLPIGACCWRLIWGWRQIETNYCSQLTRFVQRGFFLIALLCAALLDTLVVIQWELGGMHSIEDTIAMAIMFAIYLALMAVATYPGIKPKPRAPDGGYGG